MFSHLQIPYRRARLVVGLADTLIAPLGWTATPPPAPVRRVLLLRLERIGDLLMTLEAVADARAAWPDAEIDLAVGSWNAPIARLIPGIARVEIADVPWLARGTAGDAWPALLRRARAWAERSYDVVVNFEPDIRSNALAWIAGGAARFGYASGGGGAFLTSALAYAPASHVAVNARALVAAASGCPPDPARPPASLTLSAAARERAAGCVSHAARPLIGVHPSGGRESKQWHLDRFADAAAAAVRARGGTIVLTGGAGDRALVDRVRLRLGDAPVIDTAGTLDLVDLAALLADVDVLLTGDTGPMHLAAAVGTRVVALFGPSDPRRYGPIGRGHHVLRVDLPCSPCGQVRLPPERCRGHVPDCLDQIYVERVAASVIEALDSQPSER